MKQTKKKRPSHFAFCQCVLVDATTTAANTAVDGACCADFLGSTCKFHGFGGAQTDVVLFHTTGT